MKKFLFYIFTYPCFKCSAEKKMPPETKPMLFSILHLYIIALVLAILDPSKSLSMHFWSLAASKWQYWAMQETFNHWWHDLHKTHNKVERAQIWQHTFRFSLQASINPRFFPEKLFPHQLIPIFYTGIKLFLSTDYFFFQSPPLAELFSCQLFPSCTGAWGYFSPDTELSISTWWISWDSPPPHFPICSGPYEWQHNSSHSSQYHLWTCWGCSVFHFPGH